MGRINPNNTVCNIPESRGYHEFEKQPSFKVDSIRFVGKSNQYDTIASERNIVFKENVSYPIQSGIMKIIVESIKQSWKPKPNSNIHSWRSDVDYSHNSNFMPIWEVFCEEQPLFYELADFLKAD